MIALAVWMIKLNKNRNYGTLFLVTSFKMAELQNLLWSNAEVKTFLSLVAEDRMQREQDGALWNERVFPELSNAITARGGFLNSATIN